MTLIGLFECIAIEWGRVFVALAMIETGVIVEGGGVDLSQPKYSCNVAQSKDSSRILHLESHGHILPLVCTLPTLMSLYFLQKYEIITMQSFEELDHSLNSVLNLILDKKYNEAQHRWISSNDCVQMKKGKKQQ